LLNPSSVWIRGVGRTRQGEADGWLGLAVGRASWGVSYQDFALHVVLGGKAVTDITVYI